MKNRRSFLAAAVTSGIGFALVSRADAQTPSASTSPLPSPTASGPPKPEHPGAPPSTEKPPSATALALAASMRAFDTKLTDVQIAAIARGITENQTAAAALSPQRARLHNSDEPIVRFTVRPAEEA